MTDLIRMPLSAVVRYLQRGQSYKSSLVGQPGPYLIGLGTIQRNGGFRADKLRTYGGESPASILLSAGDLYVSLKDMTHAADLLGAVARVPRDIEQGRLTQDTIRLDVDEELIDRNYLYWALRDPACRTHYRKSGTGTTNLDLSRTDFLSYNVFYPSIDVQVSIAAVLEALDDKIAANSQVVATADCLAGALTRQALNGGRRRLADIASVTMGSSPPGTSYNEDGVGTVFYQGVRDFGVRFPVNRVWTTEPVRLAELGDTLLSVRAPVGRTNLANEATCVGRGLAAVGSLIGAPATLFHILREEPDVWAPFEAEGTVFGSINKKQLESLQIPSVDTGMFPELEKCLSDIESRIASALAESLQLAETRDALLPLLMSGKVRVKDAQDLVEEVV